MTYDAELSTQSNRERRKGQEERTVCRGTVSGVGTTLCAAVHMPKKQANQKFPTARTEHRCKPGPNKTPRVWEQLCCGRPPTTQYISTSPSLRVAEWLLHGSRPTPTFEVTCRHPQPNSDGDVQCHQVAQVCAYIPAGKRFAWRGDPMDPRAAVPASWPSDGFLPAKQRPCGPAALASCTGQSCQLHDSLDVQ